MGAQGRRAPELPGARGWARRGAAHQSCQARGGGRAGAPRTRAARRAGWARRGAAHQSCQARGGGRAGAPRTRAARRAGVGAQGRRAPELPGARGWARRALRTRAARRAGVGPQGRRAPEQEGDEGQEREQHVGDQAVGVAPVHVRVHPLARGRRDAPQHDRIRCAVPPQHLPVRVHACQTLLLMLLRSDWSPSVPCRAQLQYMQRHPKQAHSSCRACLRKVIHSTRITGYEQLPGSTTLRMINYPASRRALLGGAIVQTSDSLLGAWTRRTW